MKNIIALGGSNSRESINKKLAVYAANKIENAEVNVLDLNNFDLPLYGIDIETEKGIPADALRLNDLLNSADGIVISLAEHNGSYSAAFKNALDWVSRIHKDIFKNKPMLLMATSPGGRGGASVLQTASASFPRFGAQVISSFSLPSFNQNFKENGLNDEAMNNELNEKIEKLNNAIHTEAIA